MINSLNRSIFLGHLGADAKQANDAAPVTFSLAVSSYWTDNAGHRQTRTDWHNLVVFGNLRKYARKLRKGDRVYVEAEARNNHYERIIGTETVKFYETEFLAGAIERGGSQGRSGAGRVGSRNFAGRWGSAAVLPHEPRRAPEQQHVLLLLQLLCVGRVSVLTRKNAGWF